VHQEREVSNPTTINQSVKIQKIMKEFDKLNSHISNKLYMIYISYNNYRHPFTKTFNTLVDTSVLPI